MFQTALKHTLEIGSVVGMSLVSGVCYIIGTATPDVALSASTQIQFSPYALFSIIAAVASATAFVVKLFIEIRRDLRDLKSTQAADRAKIDAIRRHVINCPVASGDNREDLL